MVGPLALVLFASSAAAAPQSTAASLKTPPPALELFERDWVLMNWALKNFDADGDILLQPGEVHAAADAFRKLADTDHDGQITPEEFRAARATILTGG